MNLFKVTGFALLVVALIAIGPLITIWALNTLFGLGIAYSFFTWAATVWLTAVLSAVAKKR